MGDSVIPGQTGPFAQSFLPTVNISKAPTVGQARGGVRQS